MSQLSIDILIEKSNKPTIFELNALGVKQNKPCPFCGSYEIHFIEDNLSRKKDVIIPEIWVRCSNCGADSPPHQSRLGALQLWQERKQVNK